MKFLSILKRAAKIGAFVAAIIATLEFAHDQFEPLIAKDKEDEKLPKSEE